MHNVFSYMAITSLLNKWRAFIKMAQNVFGTLEWQKIHKMGQYTKFNTDFYYIATCLYREA